MRVAIIQPHFLPFIGYFDLMNRADVFVYYDTVQFVRRSWHCRTYVNDQGKARWLSAPVQTEGGSRCPLCAMEWADDHPWRSKMARRLEHCYANAREPMGLHEILQMVRLGPPMLADWNIAANAIIAKLLGITTPVVRASLLAPVVGDKQDRIIRLCQALGATHYLCGPGSRTYVCDRDFDRSGITVEWLTYNYQYRLPTNHGEEVFPSALDLILTRGKEAARHELRSRS
jgi:hypothetical protein